MTSWWVYVLLSESGHGFRTYVGVTTDLGRRLAEHNGERPGGAKSTRPWRPWVLKKKYGPFDDRSQAQTVEAAVKKKKGEERMSWSPEESGEE